MMPLVDLRSDTITHPTEAMREAMRAAPVGDDVYGEDPTVNRLEEMAAARLGKEAALFVPSGTMANLASALANSRQVPGLLCLENTHNLAGGTVTTPQQTTEVCAVAHGRGMRVHLDGARIFNAAVALGVDVQALGRDADSVMFCVSKGLSAPVGSLLCGGAEFIARARRTRKYLGGGMRQAGVIAAAGIVALETMVDRLAEDHHHARLLAQRLAEIPGLRVDLATVQTNIVMVEVADAPTIARRLADRGVRVFLLSPTRMRMVTHRHIGMPEVERAAEAFHQVLRVAAGKS